MSEFELSNVNLIDEHQTLQEKVFEILKEDILSGAIPPNTILNSSDLSRKLHVSRTPIRDAVNKLISIGLVVKTSYKEARVADFMSDEMYEIFCARAALEGVAAKSATKYMGMKEKEQLLEMAKKFKEYALAENEEKFMELNEEFHFKIYDCLKTSIIRDMCGQLYTITKQSRNAGYHVEGRSEQIVKEHEELALAIYNGDSQKAEEMGIKHHANTISELKYKFERLKNENIK